MRIIRAVPLRVLALTHRGGRARQVLLNQQMIALAALVLISLGFAIATPYFLTSANLLNVGRQASINMIIAMGMTVVIISAGIDLSVGSVAALTMVTMAQLVRVGGMNIWAAVVIAVIVGTLVGTLNGLIIHHGNVPPFIATLGMMGIARGVALLLTGGYPAMGFSTDFQWIGAGDVLDIPFPIILAVLVTGTFYVLLRFTPMGRRFYAIGGNEEAARLSGVMIGPVKIWAYTIAGFCAAIGGIVLASRINSAPPSAGGDYALNAIAAVVIGGTNLFGGEGTVLGTAIGALIMAVIGNGLSLLDVTSFWQQVIIGTVIILAVMLTTIRLKQR